MKLNNQTEFNVANFVAYETKISLNNKLLKHEATFVRHDENLGHIFIDNFDELIIIQDIINSPITILKKI